MNAIQMPLVNPNKNQDNKFDLEEAKTEEAAYLDQQVVIQESKRGLDIDKVKLNIDTNSSRLSTLRNSH